MVLALFSQNLWSKLPNPEAVSILDQMEQNVDEQNLQYVMHAADAAITQMHSTAQMRSWKLQKKAAADLK